ncbi:MAG: RecQ family ATP-dependent DNA helicase [Prevotella sp.]|nr:RecQ family ATP-dependent DNA helicase [Prevotella sp.]
MVDKYRATLRKYWGYDDFRGIQREIIESIDSGHDTLGLMPTGGGKSITFQVPAMLHKGVCLVVTPLIALMKDQVSHLRAKGILASAIYSGMSHQEIVTTLDNAVFGGVDILYVSPERLASELFLIKLRHMRVSFITVDEAHCISQWGYDFRPSYLRIADIRHIKPEAPVLALTATATPQVVDDIQERLAFKEKRVFRMSFERKNLAYVVRQTTDKQAELLHILSSVPGSAIVYARSRKRTKDTSEWLNACGVSATFYHAGLESGVKDQRQKEWQAGKVRVMVATNAFGMGIDKPDVRMVAHIDCPDSLEAYFQEAGRAGRDGKKAYAVLLYNSSDKRKLTKRISDTFPTKEYVREVYDHLADFFQMGVGGGEGTTHEFDIDKFCRNFHHFPVHVDAALKILQRAGYLEYDADPDNNARLRFMLARDQLYLLENTSPTEERVIDALLRLYGGLFSDYCFIDESAVAYKAGIDSSTVYMTLKGLGKRRIVHFIPRRQMPAIYYTQRREDGHRLMLTRDVYEDRKESYEARIGSMVDYATNDSVCRSRQLLRYFGETRSTDCGQCDVCLTHTPPPSAEQAVNSARERILQLLADHQRHHIAELHGLQLPRQQLDTALQSLLHEEQIHISGAFISLGEGKGS